MANASVLGDTANRVNSERASNGLKTLNVLNNAAEDLTTNYVIVIDPVDVSTYDRMSVQIRNTHSADYTTQVFGTLFGSPDAPATAAAAGSHWAQIGDDITTAATSGTIKTISTTGLKQICVRIKLGSGTDTLDAGNCIVFAQGTI